MATIDESAKWSWDQIVDFMIDYNATYPMVDGVGIDIGCWPDEYRAKHVHLDQNSQEWVQTLSAELATDFDRTARLIEPALIKALEESRKKVELIRKLKDDLVTQNGLLIDEVSAGLRERERLQERERERLQEHIRNLKADLCKKGLDA